MAPAWSEGSASLSPLATSPPGQPPGSIGSHPVRPGAPRRWTGACPAGMKGGSGGSFVSLSPLPLHPLKTLRENVPAGNRVDLSREGCEHLALVYPEAPARPQTVPSCRAAFVVPVRDEDACAGGTKPDFVSHPRGVSNQNIPSAASIPQVAAARPSLQASGEDRLSAVTPEQSPCSLWPGSPVPSGVQ